MNHKNKRRAVLTGHIGRKGVVGFVDADWKEKEESVFCEYSAICNKSCSKDEICEIKKFYKRYGIDYFSKFFLSNPTDSLEVIGNQVE